MPSKNLIHYLETGEVAVAAGQLAASHGATKNWPMVAATAGGSATSLIPSPTRSRGVEQTSI